MRQGPVSGAMDKRQGGETAISLLGVVLFVVAAAILLAAVWFAQGAADQERTAAQQREAVTGAGMAARQLGAAMSRERAQLELLATRPELVAAAAAGNMDWLAESGLQAQFPGAMRLVLLPRGWNQADPGAEPPIGFALLDMLRSAERTGEAPSPEAHLLGRPLAHVNFVQPVVADGEVRATLVLTYPVAWVQQALALPASGAGQLAVVQTPVDGESAEVVSVGGVVVGGGEHIQTIPGAGWRLRYSAPPAARVFDPLTDTWFLTITGVALVLLAISIWLVMASLRRHLLADSREWASVAQEAAAGSVRPDHPMRLKESGVVLQETLAGLSRPKGEAAAAPPSAKPAAGGGARKAPRSAASASFDDPDDLLSGLEVDENVSPEDLESFRSPARAQAQPATPQKTEKETAVFVEPSLFRAYDIRGVVGSGGLSVESVRAIGRAIGSEAAARDCAQIVVGRDGRLSSPELADALIDGLCATGREVIDIGRVPTPVTYFATYHLQTGSGVEVTGSHNPPDYNGLKIMLGGETLSGSAIADLHRRITEGDLVDGKGTARRQDVLIDYVDRIAGDVTLHRPLKVVVDCGNGVAGEVGPLVLRSLGCEVRELYCDIDGTFPNHHPDPSDPANLVDLIAAVREDGADVGLAFDGDGDRLGVVDANGKIIWPDRQMMLFAMDILSRQPGADIIFDVKCSAHLARIITDNAGVPVMWRTGHSLIKAKLKESGAPLAGEMSGHIFFNDRWDGFDDGIYAAARLLEILSMDPRSSSEIFAELPETVSTPEIKVHLQEGEPPRVIEALVARARFPEARVTTIDGLRVDFPDGWGLVRASNTTPCLVLRFEADTQAALDRIRDEFRSMITAVRPDLNPDF